MTCRYCRAAVADMAHHYARECRALAYAFDDTGVDPVKSDSGRAGRKAQRANGQCARCGGGPRVVSLSYCRECKRLMSNASRTRLAAERRERAHATDANRR